MNVSLHHIFGTYVKKTLTALTLPWRPFSGHRSWPFLQQHLLRLPVSWVQFPNSVGRTTEIWDKHRYTLNLFSRKCFRHSYSEPCLPLVFYPIKLLKSYVLHFFFFFSLRYKHQNWTQPPGNHWITSKYRRCSIFVELIKNTSTQKFYFYNYLSITPFSIYFRMSCLLHFDFIF